MFNIKSYFSTETLKAAAPWVGGGCVLVGAAALAILITAIAASKGDATAKMLLKHLNISPGNYGTVMKVSGPILFGSVIGLGHVIFRRNG